MEIHTGQPVAEGCYVAFVRCEAASAREWCEPILATWHGERWHLGSRPVYGWIGPLPIAKALDLVDPYRKLPAFIKSAEPQEFDL